MVGDALNNLRSALDYVVWQLAGSPTKKNQFPIFDTPEGFKDHRERYLCTVPPELWAKFEGYQPYSGTEEGRILGALAKLNDADKHRLLLPAAVASAAGKGRFRVSGLDSITVKARDWVPFEDGAEVYRMTLTATEGSHVKVDAEVPYSILFADPETDIAFSASDLRIMATIVYNVVESFAGDFTT